MTTAPRQRDRRAGLRRVSLVMIVLLLCQFALGMVTNLYVTIPDHHPGAQPANYLSGSVSSLGWAVGHGSAALAAHAALGFAIVAFALAAAGQAIAQRLERIVTVAGGLLIIGAAFNGASFLDFNKDVSSLIMALLFAAAVLAYVTLLYRLSVIESARVYGAPCA